MSSGKNERPGLPKLGYDEDDGAPIGVGPTLRPGSVTKPSIEHLASSSFEVTPEPETVRDLDGGRSMDSSGRLPSLSTAEDEGTSTDKTALVADRSVRSGGRPTLTVLTGLNAGMSFPLERPMTTIGRGKDVDLPLRDTGVSRQHVRVIRQAGVCVVEDLGSTNGVRVNGVKEKARELRAGDRIQLGPDVVLQFAYLDDTEENLTKQLYTAATRDPLTQALNRRAFDERLLSEFSYSRRHQTRLSIVLIDIDHFKKVNDTFGHAAGDRVLRETAEAIRRAIRSEDIFARYGGEEFVLLVRGETTAETASLADRIRLSVAAASLPWEGKQLQVTMSAGVAELADCTGEQSAEDLVKCADARLYRAKSLGRNRVVAR